MSAEARDRALLRGGIGGLLLVALVPLLPDVGAALAPFLDRCRELLAQCALVLRAAGAPLQWLPTALLATGFVYATFDRVRVRRKLVRLLSHHRSRVSRPDEPVGELAREFGLEGRVRVLVGPAPNPAFTVGVLRPRIFLAHALQQTLTPAELRAVFRHEVCHLRRRDPLRFAALRFLSKTFFWLPLLRVWIGDVMEDAEIVADDFAAARGGGVDPLDVASALIALGRANGAALAGTAGIGGFRLLDRRVRRLAGVPIPVPRPFPVRPALISGAALALFWTVSLLGAPAGHAAVHRYAHCPHGIHRGAEEHCRRCDQPHLPSHRCRM